VLLGVADVNVFVSAALVPIGPSGRVLTAAVESRWRPVVSRHLLNEARTVFGYERIRKRRSVEQTSLFMAGLEVVAELLPDAPQPWPAMTSDPKDDYLIALAKSADVDAIISGDVHLTELVALVPPVLRPADFLALLDGGR